MRFPITASLVLIELRHIARIMGTAAQFVGENYGVQHDLKMVPMKRV